MSRERRQEGGILATAKKKEGAVEQVEGRGRISSRVEKGEIGLEAAGRRRNEMASLQNVLYKDAESGW